MKFCKIIQVVLISTLLPQGKVFDANEEFQVREISNQVDYKQDSFSEYDYFNVENDRNEIRITAREKYKNSNKIDYVASIENEYDKYDSIEYDVIYYENTSLIDLDIFGLIGEEKENIYKTIRGLVANREDNADVIIYEGNEYIYLSELMQNLQIDEVSFWDDFKQWFSDLVESVANSVARALRHLTKVVVEVIGLNNAARFLCMYEDENGIYHASFNCWQERYGYRDLYDVIFDIGTEMLSSKSEFYRDDYNNQFCLWGWKGDYLELGLGAELGIYRRLGNTSIWYVDKDLAINMRMEVEYRENLYTNTYTTIIDYDPQQYYSYEEAKQWWITSFNPNYVQVLSDTDLLRATFIISFDTLGYDNKFDQDLYYAFKNYVKNQTCEHGIWEELNNGEFRLVL